MQDNHLNTEYANLLIQIRSFPDEEKIKAFTKEFYIEPLTDQIIQAMSDIFVKATNAAKAYGPTSKECAPLTQILININNAFNSKETPSLEAIKDQAKKNLLSLSPVKNSKSNIIKNIVYWLNRFASNVISNNPTFADLNIAVIKFIDMFSMVLKKPSDQLLNERKRNSKATDQIIKLLSDNKINEIANSLNINPIYIAEIKFAMAKIKDNLASKNQDLLPSIIDDLKKIFASEKDPSLASLETIKNNAKNNLVTLSPANALPKSNFIKNIIYGLNRFSSKIISDNPDFTALNLAIIKFIDVALKQADDYLNAIKIELAKNTPKQLYQNIQDIYPNITIYPAELQIIQNYLRHTTTYIKETKDSGYLNMISTIHTLYCNKNIDKSQIENLAKTIQPFLDKAQKQTLEDKTIREKKRSEALAELKKEFGNNPPNSNANVTATPNTHTSTNLLKPRMSGKGNLIDLISNVIKLFIRRGSKF